MNHIKNTKNIKILENYILYFHSYGLILSFEKNKENKINNYKEALSLFSDMINEYNTNNSQVNESI